MNPLGNINFNKILKKIAHMFMKQNYGQVFQLVEGCYALTCISHYELIGEISNIVAHGKGEEAYELRLMFNGFSLDHRSLKIGAFDVERSFTCRWLLKLWQEVVNFKNEVDKKEVARLFGEEFHTPSHIFLCIENASGL
jgi:hypothetical protein